MQNEKLELQESVIEKPLQESYIQNQQESLEANENANLDELKVRRVIGKEILAAIDNFCVDNFKSGHRNHLGASIIGHECKRHLWYMFRWCLAKEFDGRMYRLFDRGHREEERFIKWLEGIGAKVWYENRKGLTLSSDGEYWIASDPVVEEGAIAIEEGVNDYKNHIIKAKAQGIKFPQYKVSGVGGHYGGSVDAVVQLPPEYNIPFPVLGEFKTNGTGAGFNNLVNSGVEIEKEMHFAQMSVYGDKLGFEYGLYLNTCKNDDAMHVELIKLDKSVAFQMEDKAQMIITAQEPPQRISDNPTFYKCKFCDHYSICHKGEIIDKNCRSCKHAKPVNDAGWWCDLHSPQQNQNIPIETIPVGCGDYHPITSKS